MKKEDLIALGISEDVAEKIFAMHGKGLEPFKTKAADLQTQLENANKQLGEANTAIEGFKQLKPEELQKVADDWKAKYEQAQQDAQNQLAQVKFEHALETSLAGAKAKNIKAVKALLNTKDLKLTDDGKILGLDDQLEAIKKDSDYLFESDKVVPKIITKTNNQPVTADPIALAARKASGLPMEEKG